MVGGGIGREWRASLRPHGSAQPCGAQAKRQLPGSSAVLLSSCKWRRDRARKRGVGPMSSDIGRFPTMRIIRGIRLIVFGYYKPA